MHAERTSSALSQSEFRISIMDPRTGVPLICVVRFSAPKVAYRTHTSSPSATMANAVITLDKAIDAPAMDAETHMQNTRKIAILRNVLAIGDTSSLPSPALAAEAKAWAADARTRVKSPTIQRDAQSMNAARQFSWVGSHADLSTTSVQPAGQRVPHCPYRWHHLPSPKLMSSHTRRRSRISRLESVPHQ